MGPNGKFVKGMQVRKQGEGLRSASHTPTWVNSCKEAADFSRCVYVCVVLGGGGVTT